MIDSSNKKVVLQVFPIARLFFWVILTALCLYLAFQGHSSLALSDARFLVPIIGGPLVFISFFLFRSFIFDDQKIELRMYGVRTHILSFSDISSVEYNAGNLYLVKNNTTYFFTLTDGFVHYHVHVTDLLGRIRKAKPTAEFSVEVKKRFNTP